MREIEKELM